jgi:hypothetical protein
MEFILISFELLATGFGVQPNSVTQDFDFNEDSLA